MGGAFLSGVMHVPLGTALLVQRMSGCDAHGFAMLLVANYIATFLNPYTLFKQENEHFKEPPKAGPEAADAPPKLSHSFSLSSIAAAADSADDNGDDF